MTLSSGAEAEDKTPRMGTALVATDDFAGIAPFTAIATDEAPRPRGLRTLLLDYSAHAAMIVGLIGFAWTVSDHVVNRPAAPPVEQTRQSRLESKPSETRPIETRPIEAKLDPMGELRRTNAEMAQDLKALRANLDSLRASVHQDRVPEQMRALSANVESMKTGLNAAKAETGAALAQLSGKMDRLQREASLKEAAAREAPAKEASAKETLAKETSTKEASLKTAEIEHAPKGERQTVDTETTGSLPPPTKTAPVPPARPQQAKLAQLDDGTKTNDDSGKPSVIAGYVVRDVYEGVALIEGKRGALEVVPGVSIPGAGIVKSIDRHGNGWTVTTTKGVLAYAAPARETRRTPRDMYQYQPSYRYDF